MITAINGSMITAKRTDHKITRNCSWFKIIPVQHKNAEIEEDDISTKPHDILPRDDTNGRRYPLQQRKPTDFYCGQ